MNRTGAQRCTGWRRVTAGCLVAIAAGVGWLTGCAGEPPKPAPTVTPEQVRGHADKAFDKLKQEEQRRTDDPAAAR